MTLHLKTHFVFNYTLSSQPWHFGKVGFDIMFANSLISSQIIFSSLNSCRNWKDKVPRGRICGQNSGVNVYVTSFAFGILWISRLYTAVLQVQLARHSLKWNIFSDMIPYVKLCSVSNLNSQLCNCLVLCSILDFNCHIIHFICIIMRKVTSLGAPNMVRESVYDCLVCMTLTV